jgi:hypothetical protein
MHLYVLIAFWSFCEHNVKFVSHGTVLMPFRLTRLFDFPFKAATLN